MESSQVGVMHEFVNRKLVDWPEFIAALIIGSVAQGEARSDSDVDCILIFDQVNEAIIPAEFVWDPSTDTYHTIFEKQATDGNGIQIDANRVALEEFIDQEWPEHLKHDLTHALVIYDRNNAAMPRIVEKLTYPDSLRWSRIHHHFSWAAYHLEEWRLLGWLKRGGIETAHDQLNTALEEIISLLHAYNGEWLPTRHRWIISASRLAWLPNNYSERVFDTVSRVTSNEQNLLDRQRSLTSILDLIRGRLQDDGLLASPVEAFIATHPGLGYAHNFDEWRQAHRKLMKLTEKGDTSKRK